ncbi:hypothetical protein [Streptomyces sp. AHA2]|uniref:hypothetical protein n=1 Tax=Streptomyces sp. AHA2 TaxID=3064526 RepID=UPI002FE2AB46
MDAASAATAAVAFVWLGMVLAISFLEAPLKFRAPGVTLPLGLGIGRLVFRALNRVELLLAATVAATVFAGDVRAAVMAPAAVALALLAVQLLLIRPSLNRRSDRVLAGEDLPRSHAHVFYIAAEVVKVLALLALGIRGLMN